jgi:hypothetical protein
MTAKEIQKRNKRAEQLRVIQVDDETFYVESGDGKICYRVSVNRHPLERCYTIIYMHSARF